MPSRISILLAFISAALGSFSMSLGSAQEGSEKVDKFTLEQIEFFEKNVRPVLIDRCLDCHSGDDPENGLSLESRAGMLQGGKLGVAVVPGKPKESLLISAINHDEFIKMPPKEKLATVDVVNFARWVEMGAPWPDGKDQPDVIDNQVTESDGGPLFTEEQKQFWAFQTPVDYALPEVTDKSWPQSPLDYFVLSQLESHDLKPAPPADKRTLLRRATYDLTGLPPTAAEIEAFLNDDSPTAFARVVDRLLSSPRYGERWGRHWLDVARYADSNGLDENLSYANAYQYRDYVISAFNQDKPYDRFLQEQIAGDLLPESTDEKENLDRLVATGFLAIGPKMLAEDDPVKMQMDIIDEQLITLGQAFMGLTFGCARCHDHKFDPLPTADYYSLAGIFKSTKTMENHSVVAVWYERPLLTKEVSDKLAEIDAKIKDLNQQIETLKNNARQEVAKRLRRKVGRYLLATRQLAQFDSQSKAELADKIQIKTEQPFSVRDGYALIEAEAFHRGNVDSQNTGYGEGIGVILTFGPGGFAEYDLDVSHAGTYQLEVRYAAADSRTIKLIVNGKEIEPAICGQVTGSWNPDGQNWFVEAQVELTAGKNTIKFDSPKVYPHIDKFALVFTAEKEWPFESAPPLSLSRIAVPLDVNMEMVAVWQNYLKDLAAGKLADHNALLPWIEYSKLAADDFEIAAAKLTAELQSNEGLGSKIPQTVKDAFATTPPKSLADVASIYQRLIDQIDETFLKEQQDPTELAQKLRETLEPLRREFADERSPASGPPAKVKSLYSIEKRQQLDQLSDSLASLNASRPVYNVAMGVTESKPEDLKVHLRGSHITLGETAPRRFPRIIAGDDQQAIAADHSGRLEFARWLTQADHPLTGRVMVNRVWHWHFGRGLVASVDNFGRLGDRPTHPQLLDWLACRFVESGWSIKEMHRLMMLSSTYQMSTQFNETAAAADPENQWLWRINRRRLSAEEVRDSMIAIGSGLDFTTGGSLLKVKNREYVTVSGTNVTDEYNNRRRSVYLPVVRSAVYEVFQTLDFPDPAVLAGQRQTTTVSPQALLMMNSQLVSNETRSLAERLIANSGSGQARIQAAYREILGREANENEVSSAAVFIERATQLLVAKNADPASIESDTWQSLCRVLASSNEFFYVE